MLTLLAEGWSNDAIAAGLGVTLRTVETHVGRIFLKLDVAADPAIHRRVLAVLTHLRACS